MKPKVRRRLARADGLRYRMRFLDKQALNMRAAAKRNQQRVLDQLPQTLRHGQAVRITPNVPGRSSGAEKAEALLILKAATGATWSTDWDNDKCVFCVPRCDIETGLRERSQEAALALAET